ncbi:DUF6042 family protein [Hamadaea tsunoensis]|uniref:DUF6042 family protein n=1 Tax=Hamadaea tsunoensis TaxID=53368 RepID=UPI0003F68253|nr:DUF6042 family protein [Hamadaea tsunoensis]
MTWQAGDEQPQWRFAPMHPSWVRWLPCAVASLRVVPAEDPTGDAFPRRWYDHPALDLPWDDPVWCDPGPVEEWIEQSRGASSEADARAHYARVIQARTRRIDIFTECCARSDVPVPLNLRQLVDCLVGLGVLWEFEGADGTPWITANFAANPLDLLALTPQEAADEASAQILERGVLAGIGLRRLAEQQAPEGGGQTVWLTLRQLGDEIDLTPAAARLALGLIASEEHWISVDPHVDLQSVKLDQPFVVKADHDRLALVYDMDELIAPEHLI